MQLGPRENRELNERERALRLPRVESHPPLLTVESTSVCNLRCVMCPQAIGVERPRHISDDLVDPLRPFLAAAEEIQLHGIGEPMLSPAFWQILDRTADGEPRNISVNSNAQLLTDRLIEKLLDSGLSQVNFSLDAATAPTYAKIRGADFDKAVGNIRKTIEHRNERGQTHPDINLNMTLMRANISEAKELVRLGADLGVNGVWFWHLNDGEDWTIEKEDWTFDYKSQQLSNVPDLSDRELRAAVAEGNRLGLPVFLDHNKVVFFGEDDGATRTEPAEGMRVPTSASDEELPTVKDCTYPWRWMMVTSDGEAAACCYMSRPALGNLENESPESIWNGERMQRLRRRLSAGEVDPLCAGAACKYVAATRDTEPAPRSRLRVGLVDFLNRSRVGRRILDVARRTMKT